MKFALCILLGHLLFGSVWAGEELDCRQDYLDPYEPQARINSGAYRGKCLDTSNIRSYRILAQDKNVVTVANFFHAGKFFLAKINTLGVKRIIFQLERFDPQWLAAHTQLRFTFDEHHPVVLIDQKNPDTPPVYLHEIILSVEAAFMQDGPNYDLWKGMHGFYGLAFRLLSLDQRFVESVTGQDHPVEQILLQPDQKVLKGKREEWKGEFLQFALFDLESPDMDGVYHTLYVNCTNSLFRSFDKFFKRTGKPGRGISATWPIFSKQALEKRGLIQAKSQLLDLKDEFLPLTSSELYSGNGHLVRQ